MSSTAANIPEAMDRLRSSDPTLKAINLMLDRRTDSELAELIDCLITHPNVVTQVYLGYNQLTDETGIKLARYVATNSTIQYLGLECNQFSSATYLAMATAMRVNTSLRALCIYNNQVMDKNCIKCINAAFVDALILNPNRPAESIWSLYAWSRNEFERLKKRAEKLGHPSMQASLAITVY